MSEKNQKSLPLAIGLNILLPGAGYMYMGKIVVGVLALLLVIGIYLTTGIFFIFGSWLFMNILMAIDMMILHNKRQKQYIDGSTKKCPYCAELVKNEAKICKHCGKDIVPIKQKPVPA